jgi:hypothetical protein
VGWAGNIACMERLEMRRRCSSSFMNARDFLKVLDMGGIIVLKLIMKWSGMF